MDPTSAVAAAQSLTELKQSSPVTTNYGASLTSDVQSFAQSMDKAAQNASAAALSPASAGTAAPAVAEPSETAKALFRPLDSINAEAQKLLEYAQEATASGHELTPSEIVMLTVRSQEFMFHAQLTSNVANRTADGMQQLFKQQG